MATTEEDVTAILDVLSAAGADPRLAGGWGIDALVGRQTREHRDLDVMVLAHRVEAALVGLHLRADGSGWQSGLDGTRFDYSADAWTRGSIAGQDVPCLTAARQRELRLGYAHREQDRHDLAVLDGLAEE